MDNSADLEAPYAIRRYDGESHEAMAGIRELRKLCWNSIYEAGGTLEDGFDDRAIHWVISDGEEVLAAARLTTHTDLVHLPESDLFESFRSTFDLFPLGYISRLVVHPRMRGRGLAAKLDEARMEAAVALGCVAMVVTWTPLSGDRRRQRLLEIGFVSLDGNTAITDELFGYSCVYFMSLRGDDRFSKEVV